MNRTSKFVITVATFASALGMAGTASADPRWDRDHPRQGEVEARLHDRVMRSYELRRQGRISAGEAERMRAEARADAHRQNEMIRDRRDHRRY